MVIIGLKLPIRAKTFASLTIGVKTYCYLAQVTVSCLKILSPGFLNLSRRHVDFSPFQLALVHEHPLTLAKVYPHDGRC